jgi:hypothetical protein
VRRPPRASPLTTCCPAYAFAGAAVFTEEILGDGVQALVY